MDKKVYNRYQRINTERALDIIKNEARGPIKGKIVCGCEIFLFSFFSKIFFGFCVFQRFLEFCNDLLSPYQSFPAETLINNRLNGNSHEIFTPPTVSLRPFHQSAFRARPIAHHLVLLHHPGSCRHQDHSPTDYYSRHDHLGSISLRHYHPHQSPHNHHESRDNVRLLLHQCTGHHDQSRHYNEPVLSLPQ